MTRHAATAHWDALYPTLGETGLMNANIPVRFQITGHDHGWEVSRNAKPFSRHTSRAQALASVRDAMQAIFMTGGAARLLTA